MDVYRELNDCEKIMEDCRELPTCEQIELLRQYRSLNLNLKKMPKKIVFDTDTISKRYYEATDETIFNILNKNEIDVLAVMLKCIAKKLKQGKECNYQNSEMEDFLGAIGRQLDQSINAENMIKKSKKEKNEILKKLSIEID